MMTYSKPQLASEKEPLRPVRLIGVTVSNLTETAQLSLFDETENARKLSEVMDTINARFKRGVITKGRTLINEDTQ